MFLFEHTSAWFLLLLLILPLLWWRWARPGSHAMIGCSSTKIAAKVPRSWIVRTRWIIPVLRTIAVVSLIICVARPLRADHQTKIHADAVAIEMVVDRSGSMQAQDFIVNGTERTRLEVVQQVVADFILGVDTMEGRSNDLIGLVSFASFPDSNCPMTFDHEHLVGKLGELKVATEAEGPNTAIGDAIGLAIARLTSLQDRADIRSEDEVKSRVIILLTDGEENTGDIDSLKAAEIAKAFGIRIYTIGAGSTGRVPIIVKDDRGRETRTFVESSLDEASLKAVADQTGGQYFRARDTESLQEIYARINELEKSKIIERQYEQFADMSVDAVRLGGINFPPLLIIPFLALLLELGLAHTAYRRLP